MFVESFRPGVADRLGVGYEAITAGNPAIVYCSVSDLAVGVAAAFAITAACLGARQRGRGERIDVSVADVLATGSAP